MRINKQALSRPEFRKLRDNLQVIHGTQPTVVGSLLSTLAAIGELVFTIALVVVLIMDTRYTGFCCIKGGGPRKFAVPIF